MPNPPSHTRTNSLTNSSGGGGGSDGFSLMNSLGGGTSSPRSPSAISATIASSTAIPLSRTGNSNSFTSSSSYQNSMRHSQQQPQQPQHQQLQQQQRRRVASYRSGQPTNSPPQKQKQKQQQQQQQQQHQQQQQQQLHRTLAGISPSNSMDSGDQQRGGIAKTSSFDDCYKSASEGFHDAFALLSPVSGAVTGVAAGGIAGTGSPSNATRLNSNPSNINNNRRSFFPSSPIKSPRHHHHHPHPQTTIGGDHNGGQSNSNGNLNSHLDHPLISSAASSTPTPTINKTTTNNTNTTINKSSGIFSTTSPSNNPPISNHDNASSSSIATTTMGNKSSGSPAKKDMPAPPSAAKSKHGTIANGPTTNTNTATTTTTNNNDATNTTTSNASNTTNAASAATTTATVAAATTGSSTRHASPMAPSRMKQTLQKTWIKAKNKSGVKGSGHHVRQRSKGSGSYSEAVTMALQLNNNSNDDIDDDDGIGIVGAGAVDGAVDGVDGNGNATSQDGIEVISPSSTPSSSGKRAGIAKNRLRMRNRSPSPIRYMGVSPPGNTTNEERMATKEDTAATTNTITNTNNNNNTRRSSNNDSETTSNDHSSSNHPDEDESTANTTTSATPSFFSGRGRSIRAMSPARMKKNLKKRLLAIPASPRRDNHPPQSQQHQQHQQVSTNSGSSLGESNSNPPPLGMARPRGSPRLPLHPTIEVGSNADEDEDGIDDTGVNKFAVNTSMSFDVDDYETTIVEQPEVTEDEAGANVGLMVLASKGERNYAPIIENNIGGYPLKDISENDVVEEKNTSYTTSSSNIFESKEFIYAMGGKNEASLATNYIRTGDALCANDTTREFDRAIPAYYAGLGAILSRVRKWAMKQRGEDKSNGKVEVDAMPTTVFNLLQQDFLDASRSTEMNVLLLAMSSILLRAGNAHFRLKHWETACRDYNSAQSYRTLRRKALSPLEGNRQKSNGDGKARQLEDRDLLLEDAMLDGRISNNIASAKSKRQMYEEARSEYTEALRIKQSTLQALHEDFNQDADPTSSISSKEMNDDDLVSDIATTLHNIGLLRSKCGEPKKAEKAYTQSLSLRVKKFGLDDLGVSSTLCALGDLYFNEKRYDDAFRSYKESLRIWKLQCGKSDLKSAELYYNIGLVFYSKGPYTKAKVSMVECLRIRREQCGNESLNTASALYLLGSISSAMGNCQDAISQLNEALSIRQKCLGNECPNHLLLLNVHLAIGRVHHLNGDFDKAMASFSVALMGRTERLGKHHPSVSEVLQAIGVAYIAANEFSKALETLEETLRLRRGLLGPSMEVAETLDSLSLVFFKSGDTEKAIELCEESLSVLKTAVGFDHVLVSKVLKNMGDYNQDIEEYNDAIESYNESLRVMTLWHGRDHLLLSEVLNEIGVTRFKKGEYMIARQSFTQALRIMRSVNNEATKSAIFPTLTHLGHALYKNKDLKLATDTYLESFNIQVTIVTGEENHGLQDFGERLNTIMDKVSSTEHTEEDVTFLSESLGGIASILRYLGLVYQEQGDFETALSVNKQSLSVRLCQPFKEYSAIALMAETIAMFEFKRTNLNSALDYFNQALDAKKSYQGDSTIDVARTVNNLANIHFSLGNLDDAMRLYQDALEIKRLCLGNDSDEVANTLNNIAHVMVTAGKEQEALQSYHNVVRIRQERYGKNHISVAATLSSMGDVYIKLGKLEIAMTYFEQCIRIQKLHQNRCDERVLENLASIYGKLGEWNKAESAFKEVVNSKRSAHGNDCIDIAKTLDLLAVSYIEQDRYIDSVEHLQEALRIRKVCLGGEDDEILASLNKLAFVFKSCEMIDEMMEVKAEFEDIQNRRKA